MNKFNWLNLASRNTSHFLLNKFGSVNYLLYLCITLNQLNQNIMFVSVKDLPIFKSTDKLTLLLKYRNKWVDYCPCEGVNEVDDDALFSFVTFTFNGFYYTLIKPKIKKNYDNVCDEYKLFSVLKYSRKQIYEMANNFNTAPFIYKASKLVFNDESLFMILSAEPIYEVLIKDEKQMKKELKKVMKKFVV